MYNTLVIGVDQSYQNTGISIAADGQLKDVRSVHMEHNKTHSQSRRALRRKLSGLLKVVVPKAEHVVCVVERARVHGGETSFINVDAIKAMGALTALVVDCCDKYNVPVYSVDTRCWKSQVVGTCKPKRNKYGVPDGKWPTVEWVCSKGFEDKILMCLDGTRKTKGCFERGGHKYMYNNDAADSAGIAMYWFLGDKRKLKEEH